MVILPAIFIGALRGATHWAAALLPFVVLVVGLRRRSEVILLGVFPAALLVPIALEPQLASASVNNSVRFAFVAIGAIAYLFGVSFFSTFHEPPAPRSVRMLSSALVPPSARLQRRERVYWELTAMSIAIPTTLIAWINHDETLAAYIGAMYPGRIAMMTTLLTAGALVLWLAIYHYAFLGALRPHRTGDRDLVDALNRARTEVKAGTLRMRFYVAVTFALVAMLSLVALRSKG